MTLHETQNVQESWYGFPYHYVTALEPSFSIARVYDWHINYASTIKFIISQVVAEERRASIIDIGCGDGRLSHEMQRALPHTKICGIDYSEKAIRLAKALNQGSQITFEARDLVKKPIVADFDVAMLIEVYEHIEPELADDFLKGVRDTLRPGGVLHLTVPHSNIPIAPHHFRHFDSSTLTSELSKYFEIDVVMPFERISGKRRWLNRLLCNRLFVLNHSGMLNAIFRYYMRNLFHVDAEEQCQRIYVRATRK